MTPTFYFPHVSLRCLVILGNTLCPCHIGNLELLVAEKNAKTLLKFNLNLVQSFYQGILLLRQAAYMDALKIFQVRHSCTLSLYI
jgi:hypothetical protein